MTIKTPIYALYPHRDFVPLGGRGWVSGCVCAGGINPSPFTSTTPAACASVPNPHPESRGHRRGKEGRRRERGRAVWVGVTEQHQPLTLPITTFGCYPPPPPLPFHLIKLPGRSMEGGGGGMSPVRAESNKLMIPQQQ